MSTENLTRQMWIRSSRWRNSGPSAETGGSNRPGGAGGRRPPGCRRDERSRCRFGRDDAAVTVLGRVARASVEDGRPCVVPSDRLDGPNQSPAPVTIATSVAFRKSDRDGSIRGPAAADVVALAGRETRFRADQVMDQGRDLVDGARFAPCGILEIMYSTVAGAIPSRIAVRMTAGEIALTVMSPLPASSFASDLVKAITAALDAE